LSKDGPAKVTPFAVTLKTDAVPRRSRARRYSPEHTKFVRNHIEMLVRRGCLKWNPHSKWSSPVMIVPKPRRPGEFRMTLQFRYVNSQVILIAGYLPILEVILQLLAWAFWFESLDAFKGFWQFPYAKFCQEI